MTHYDTSRQVAEIKSASWDDLLDGDYGPSLADAAEALVEAFTAMSAAQIITACHHDYRLSSQIRRAAENLEIAVEVRAEELASQAGEDLAFQRGWDEAGDRMALERVG